jgi:hypothetical protein
LFTLNIPTETSESARIIEKEKNSSGRNMDERMEPEMGMINLNMVISPALWYFNKEYHNPKAMADKKAE